MASSKSSPVERWIDRWLEQSQDRALCLQMFTQHLIITRQDILALSAENLTEMKLPIGTRNRVIQAQIQCTKQSKMFCDRCANVGALVDNRFTILECVAWDDTGETYQRTVEYTHIACPECNPKADVSQYNGPSSFCLRSDTFAEESFFVRDA